MGWTGWQLTRCSNTCTLLRPPQVSLQKLCPSLDLDMAYPSPDSMLGAKIWQTLVSYCFSLRYFQGDIKAASYENHGTDIYIYVQALAKESVSWSHWHDHWSSTQGAPFNLAVSCQVEKLPIWSETASSKMSTEREVQNWTYWQNHFENQLFYTLGKNWWLDGPRHFPHGHWSPSRRLCALQTLSKVILKW